jgi:hypothetical protein
MEGNLKKMKMEDDLNNCFKTRMTTYKKIEDQHKKMEDNLKKKEDDLNKIIIGKRPHTKMEDELNKNRRRPKFLLAYNHSTKINLIGRDTIVNSPSFH